jgi:hypothetical protein
MYNGGELLKTSNGVAKGVKLMDTNSDEQLLSEIRLNMKYADGSMADYWRYKDSSPFDAKRCLDFAISAT